MGFFRGRHSTSVQRENKISEFTVNTAKYGDTVPEILGTTRISGNVIYYDDFTAHEHRTTETQKTGKGGHSKHTTVTITYTYTVAVILGLCEGEISGIKRIWKGKDSGEYPYADLTLFNGKQDQAPWAYVVGAHPEKAMAYEGLAYMAGVVDLGDSSSLPTFNFEVAGKLLSTGDGVDVNPADYIRYVLDKVGLSSVEIIGLDNYRSYCKAADLLISTPNDSTANKSARDTINEIAELTNAFMFWSNDSFKIVPLEDRQIGSWTPDKTIVYELSAKDFIPQPGGALVSYQRKDSSEIYNYFPVEFIDRSNGYEKSTVSYAINDDIANFGLRQASTLSAHYIYTKERAIRVAEMLARKAQAQRNKYTFKLGWSYCLIEVGDIVTLTDESCGLTRQPAVVESVTESSTGILTLTAYPMPAGDYVVDGKTISLGKQETIPKVQATNIVRPTVDYDVSAGETTPCIIWPPYALSTTGHELWIGAKGGTNWGGCEIHASEDGTNYSRVGQCTNTARFGTLAAAVDKDGTAIEVSVNGNLLSGNELNAENGDTLCWLDGECLSYQTAELLENGHYKLSGCIRGQYGTTASAHSNGAEFARLDSAFQHVAYKSGYAGHDIHLKFLSFNVFGSGTPDISTLKDYNITLQEYQKATVTDVKLRQVTRDMGGKQYDYSVVVSWELTAGISSSTNGVWRRGSADGSTYSDWELVGYAEGEITAHWCIGGYTYQFAVANDSTQLDSVAKEIIKIEAVEEKTSEEGK